ncbi:hypothetical protein D9611_002673 [Ephemerocybe angulata]|uniref:SET domain-containing protein n=1 Tax=Ephemerocybe angulata TaxID=980116 RepID=A0A8H5C1N5_9AGAR|nr:hypothetical protein D9611_002673 [Tulosesus angulatus]
MAGARLSVVVNKDFAAGETIYKVGASTSYGNRESPIVATLDEDVQLAGTHCTHCFRIIEAGQALKSEESENVFPSAYCSKACLAASEKQSQSILFTLKNPLPEALAAGPTPPEMTEKRKAAQAAFVQGHKGDFRNVPMLTARFVARQVALETQKLLTATALSTPSAADEVADFTDAEKSDYTLADHTERFRYTDVAVPPKDLSLLSELLAATLPGLEQFTTEERHAAMESKMLYNAYGVAFDGGRDDRPTPLGRPEDIEHTRTPQGTERQIGSAIYTLSSYLTHSCTPSATVAFSAGTTELHLVALQPLKKGDLVTIAFVDVAQREGETVVDCRRRRRVDLARGWKFACGCARCAEEAEVAAAAAGVAGAEAEADVAVKDEAKVDEALRNFEMNLPRRHDEPEPESEPEVQAEPAVADAAVAVEKEGDRAEEVVIQAVEHAIVSEVEQAVHQAVEEAVEAAVEEVVPEIVEEVAAETIEEVVEKATEQAVQEVIEETLEEEAAVVALEIEEPLEEEAAVAAEEIEAPEEEAAVAAERIEEPLEEGAAVAEGGIAAEATFEEAVLEAVTEAVEEAALSQAPVETVGETVVEAVEEALMAAVDDAIEQAVAQAEEATPAQQ